MQQKPLLSQILKEPHIISYRKERSLKRNTRKSKNITKARKPNHVFRSRVGLSGHINKFGAVGLLHFTQNLKQDFTWLPQWLENILLSKVR